MAYNPFNIFRRNQKALFAVLTVFIMVMFILQPGVAGADFFEKIGQWLGSKGGNDAVCKIDGRRVTARELHGNPQSLQFRRVIANKFMYAAAFECLRELRGYTTRQREKLSPEGQQLYDMMQGVLDTLSGRLDQQSQLFARFDPIGHERQVQESVRRGLQLAEMVEARGSKEEDKSVARTFLTALALARTLREAPRDTYFINAPNRTDNDLIEFLLWEKKADQLGIRFGRGDVKRLLTQEFYGTLKDDVLGRVWPQVRDIKGFTVEGCEDALAAEFRVRLAQESVLGYGGRTRGGPMYSTPYEAFEFYRDRCSPTTYEVLRVPAALWLDKVTGEPAETERKRLYDQHANDEPNPKNETPGFRTPRKIEVAFFAVTGEEPYYQKLATEQIKVGEAMAKMSGALTVPVPGAGGFWYAGLAAPLSLREPAVDAAYAAKVKEFEGQLRQSYGSPGLSPRSRFSTLEADDPILPTSVIRPGVAAATLGAMVGQTAGFGSPVAAAALATAAPVAYEIRQRVGVGVPLVLGACPGPALLPTAVAGAAVYQAREPKPLPIEALRPDLLKDTIEKRARVLAVGPPRGAPAAGGEKGDVERFREEIKKLSEDGRARDKAAVEKYVKEFAAARGLTLGRSTAPHDEWTLEDDPGLAPLVAAQRLSLAMAGGAHGGQYMPFGRSFFWKDSFDPMTFAQRRGPSAGLYQAETYPPQESEPRPGQPLFVVWRTEDVASKKVDRTAAAPAVTAAWRRIKARELARKWADEAAEKIRTSDATSDVTLDRLLNDYYFDLQRDAKDPKVAAQVKKFKIDAVAPLVTGFRMQPYQLRESNDIPYPTPEMATALVDNRDKGFKTTLVLPDAPKDTYYVAVLMRRDPKGPDEYERNVASARGTERDILELYRAETMKKSRESIADLLKTEFRFEATDDQKKKLEDNAKAGGRGDE